MEDTVGHAGSRVPGAAKAGILHLGRSMQGPDSEVSPSAFPPCACCHAFIHWQEHNRVSTPHMGTHASTHPGARTHTAEVSTLPQPPQKPRCPAKVPAGGQALPSPC